MRKPGKVQAALLLLLRGHPNGLTFEQISDLCPQASHPGRSALNSLVEAGLITKGTKTTGTGVVYFPSRGLLDVGWREVTDWRALAGEAT